MTEEQKIAFLERLAASGANIGQINLGDGHQYIGCKIEVIGQQALFDSNESSNSLTTDQWATLDAVFRSSKTMIGIYRKMANECSKPQDFACMICVLFDYNLIIERNAYEDISRAFKVLGHDVPGNSLGYSLRKLSVKFHDWDYNEFRTEKDKCTSLEAHLSSFPGVKYRWD